MSKTSSVLLFVITLILTFFAGAFFSQKLFSSDSQQYLKTEKRETGFTFINPLLECEFTSEQGNYTLKNIKTALEKTLENYSNKSISVYYRDLSNGPWYGHNENATFAPQSLLKLPVAISYLKLSEENPSLLTQKIKYETVIQSNLEQKDDLVLGEEYQVIYLIERSMTLLDNIAFNLLVAYLPPEQLKKTHEALGIEYPSKKTPNDFVSVKSYSAIFRILYNSSYLSRKNSEYLLNILSETKYSNALTKGVPENISISHKFGLLNKDSNNIQLHDCGIVYYPNKPYLLCVMTKGNNLEELEKTITHISKTIYESVDTSQTE